MKITYSTIKAKITNTIPLTKEQQPFYENISKYCENATIIDIGAGNGWFIRVIRNFTKKNNIYAYEPIKRLSDELQDLKLNNVQVFRKAITNHNGKIRFYELETEALSSTKQIIRPYQSYAQGNKPKNTYNVQTNTLDNLKIPDNKKYFVKIDVQGGEKEVLEGGKNFLKNKKCEAVLLECSIIQHYKKQATFLQLYQQMHNYGYEIKNILPIYSENGTLHEIDALFTKKEIKR